jgi:hypothetical protein
MGDVIDFPIVKETPTEALEFAKGWDFETVFICGLRRKAAQTKEV